jgi:hypothetical protein
VTATAIEMPLLFAGDVVTLNPSAYSGHVGVEFVVHDPKRSKASIKVKGEPLSNGFTANMSGLIKTGTTCFEDIRVAEDAERERQAAIAAARAEATPKMGAVVRLKEQFRNYTVETLMVVLKVNPKTVALSRLGGDLPGERGMVIDPRGVTIVDIATVLA